MEVTRLSPAIPLGLSRVIRMREVLDAVFGVFLITGCPRTLGEADTSQITIPVIPTDPKSNQSSWQITKYKCPEFSPVENNAKERDFAIFRSCAELVDTNQDHNPDQLLVRVEKNLNNTGDEIFGDRPYQLRQSKSGDPCGHHSYSYPVLSSQVDGVGTAQITFQIPLPDSAKVGEVLSVCPTASVKEEDLDYDPKDPEQEVWWYDKYRVTVERVAD